MGRPHREAFEGAGCASHLHKCLHILKHNHIPLQKLEALDNGKAVTSAQWDYGFGVTAVRYYAGWVDKIMGNVVPSDPRSSATRASSRSASPA